MVRGRQRARHHCATTQLVLPKRVCHRHCSRRTDIAHFTSTSSAATNGLVADRALGQLCSGVSFTAIDALQTAAACVNLAPTFPSYCAAPLSLTLRISIDSAKPVSGIIIMKAKINKFNWGGLRGAPCSRTTFPTPGTGLKIAAPAPQPAVEAAPNLPHFSIDFLCKMACFGVWICYY
jgi:hypothetical protein